MLHRGGPRLWPLLLIRHVYAQVAAGGLLARPRAPFQRRSVFTSCWRS